MLHLDEITLRILCTLLRGSGGDGQTAHNDRLVKEAYRIAGVFIRERRETEGD